MSNHQNENPQIGESGVPLWIKIMWVFAVCFVATYMFMALRSGPTSW